MKGERPNVLTRALLISSALTAPYYVSLAQRSSGGSTSALGMLILAGGLASSLLVGCGDDSSSSVLSGTPDSESVTVVTEDKAYPVLYIAPRTARTSGFEHKVWVAVVWKAGAADTYPVKLGTMDTNALVGAGKMQADCDDLRVYNGANEIDRWILDPNTATTDVWVNLDFEAEQSVLLGTAIAGAGAITEIDANGDISGFPNEGLLWIDAECFTYQGKNDVDRQFLNVTREARGTAAAL